MKPMKPVSIILSLVLILSLIACGSSGEVPSNTTQPTNASPLQPSEGAGEPTVVKLVFTNGDIDELWGTSNEVQMLKEKLNIELDYSFMDNEKFSLALAGGDLPDICSTRQQFLATIIDNKLALDVAPLLEEYAPNILLDYYTPSNELIKMLMGGPEHKQYFIAPAIGPENVNAADYSSRGYIVRWDLYKQLGNPVINNDDDYLKVLKDMQALYPKTEDGLPVYGMGVWDDFVRWFYRGAFIRDTGGVNPWTFSGSLYMAGCDDAILYNGYTNTNRSAYWTDMRFFNKLYNEGLLDPDSFTMTMSEQSEKVKAGQYVGNTQYDGGLYDTMREKDPNTMAGFMMIPSVNTVVASTKLSMAGNLPTDSLFISSKSENWEAALTVLNFFHDPEVVRVMYNGKKVIDWDYDADNKPFLTQKAIDDRLKLGPNSDVFRKTTGIYGRITDFSPLQPTALDKDGNFFDIGQEYKYRAMTLSPLQKDFAVHYGKNTPSEYIQSFIDEGKTIGWFDDYAQTVAIGINEIPTDIQRIMNNCNDIMYRALPELVMAENEDKFLEIQNRIFDDLKTANEPTAWAWCEKAFNDSKAIVEPIFREAQKNYLNRVDNKK